jgi:uncharacterized protein YfbU (UPF0304 family)
MSKLAENMSFFDRYMLINQLRILEVLYPDEADSLSVQREALENGYEILYDWAVDFISDGDDKMSPEESKEVWDTMDMFDAINRAVERHGENIIEGRLFTKFRGYDGNNETKFMAFAAFTVERLKRFEYVPMDKKGYWNSHMPVRDVYQRMLTKWREVATSRRFELTPEEVSAILDEAIHPENRPA